MNKKFYITTAIPYVNASPHIGFALEIVQTDCAARYHRIVGDETYFLTGTDENALKNVQAAEKAQVPVKEFVDKNAEKFKDLKKALNLSNDDFIRTTEERHFKGAQKLWLATKKEDIYKKKYKGLYCVGCELFYKPEELDKNGRCFEHPDRIPEVVEEENYFFKLSKYEDWLLNLIENDRLQVIPQIRKNEVLSLIKQGLPDFSISRTKERAHGWGVPIPNDSGQIMYVWYDALANYITALDYAEDGELFKKFWIENENRVHVIGKGVSRFHAIYWPAILESVSLPIPKTIFVHGYVNIGGQKISKSLGNVIDPFEQVEKYGTDAVRYYLLREIPSCGDGDYNEQRFKEIYNSDLANGLGNLVARVAKLCETANVHFNESIHRSFDPKIAKFLEEFRFSDALETLWKDKVVPANKYIDENKPWELKGDPLKKVLEHVVKEVLEIAYNLKPFLPETAEKIEKQFKGPKIKSEAPLFPRL